MVEYYEGILFLTTNRVDELDEAFINRVHVTLPYPSLNPESRSQIWKHMVETNPMAISRSEDWTEKVYAILGELKINVRS
jgi:SpoVK/Ycf46/Vps4 family AAA+-type ATPase